MSKIEVNTVEPQCGTTLTLGACGQTVALGSGASQTGFGRTGTVDWDTSPKTGTVTAATGKGYFVDTTSGGITVNLPAGAAGSIVAVSDYASTAASNNITIEPNGSEKINAVNDGYTISTAGLAVTLVYVDATRGWKSVTGSDADATGVAPAFVAATGGTPCAGLAVGDYKYHKFTGNGTFIVTCGGNADGSNTVQSLVVAGGGGATDNASGGAGAGGLRNASCVSVTATPYAVTVGGGGATAGPGCGPAITPGVDSTFSIITSAGGGRGGVADPSVPGQAGAAGGSGGGGVGNNRSSAGGAGNTPAAPAPLGGPQGSSGGSTCASSPNQYLAGGGGGGHATAGESHCGPAGSPGTTQSKGGDGGDGTDTTPSFPAPTGGATFAGGGGGGASNDGGGTQPGGATTGGGGAGGTGGAAGAAGCTNTGGGGGGGPTAGGGGGAGGSGIVIIKYKFQ